MASTVYTVEEITLQDGTVVELKPLKIKLLRKFGPMLQDFFSTEPPEDDEEDGEDVLLDKLMNMAGYCISGDHPEYFTRSTEEDEIRRVKDKQEDAFDMDTIYHIIEVTTGTRLKADPEELRRALKEAEEAKTLPGKTS